MLSRSTQSDCLPYFDMVLPSVIAANQKQAMRLAAHEVAKMIGIGERILSERLQEKESIASSTISDGVMITPMRLSGLNNPLNIFVKFKTPVPMNTADKTDIDILCLVLTPEREGNSYLPTMARMCRMLRQPGMVERLRDAEDERAIRTMLEQASITLRAA